MLIFDLQQQALDQNPLHTSHCHTQQYVPQQTQPCLVLCTGVALGGLSVSPAAWSLNGSYVLGGTGLRPLADI